MNKKKVFLVLLCFVLLIPVVILSKVVIVHYQTRDGLCIVGYHNVVKDEEKESRYADNRYVLSETQFRRQMDYLYQNHYETLSMDQVYDYYQGHLEISKKAIALTFDDGYKDFNRVVKPILKEYGFTGTCFVIGKHLNDQKEIFLKTEDIQNTSNVYYYSHSYDLHRTAKGFDKKIIEKLSLKEIQDDFKKNPLDSTYFAFPYGRSREGIENILNENHVKLAFSYNQFRHMTRKDNRYYLPRYMIVDIVPDFYFQWIVE